ncbi:hypothetical protein BS50DRAFT_570851 [Corynespora cassiicola Philippines]|uniref:Clr5 domain-containing protein n=1 Tax=Corynespora cassiicola Philippines TaxID=1448308 RepID=A0A2T2P1G9_CORCC|nr:hypothetical protein BS50DRAFT_570851 [Corynespora cassiicola Philippines]
MASLIPTQPTVRLPYQSYSSDEWEKKRITITQLYRDKARSLKDVLGILQREHDFRPTTAMLKKRITKWSLDRKNKQSDMLTALQLAFHRKTQGKETIFRIRGRLVTLQEVERYFHRKGARDLVSLVSAVDIAKTSDQVECSTPEPQEVSFVDAIHGIEIPTGFIDVADRGPCGKLDINGTLFQVEWLLRLCEAYYKGTERTLSSEASTKTVVSMSRFDLYWALGHYFLEKQDTTQAFRNFNVAFDRVYQILTEESFTLPYHLYTSLLLSRTLEGDIVSSFLVRFLYQMGQACFPHQHPIQQLLYILLCLPLEDRKHSLERLMRLMECRMDSRHDTRVIRKAYIEEYCDKFFKVTVAVHFDNWACTKYFSVSALEKI